MTNQLNDKPNPMEQQKKAREAMQKIPHKFLVMSGKGGVGKTSVAVNLAFAFGKLGYKVGLMDVDIHGPNVPTMAGTEGQQAVIEMGKISPVIGSYGVKILSISEFLPDPDSPIIWRGPMKMGAIQQFMTDADWSGTEVLVVDCPPGTGDEPLTVAQMMPDAEGAIIVTSPQNVALLDSRKSVNFALKMKLPVAGIVENMSGFVCPNCGDRIDLFATGGGEKAANQMKVPFLGRIPLVHEMVTAGDCGSPLVESTPDNPAAVALLKIADKLREGWDAPNDAEG